MIYTRRVFFVSLIHEFSFHNSYFNLNNIIIYVKNLLLINLSKTVEKLDLKVCIYTQSTIFVNAS